MDGDVHLGRTPVIGARAQRVPDALRRILLNSGVAGLPILDWFHLAMRLQHLTQVAVRLSSDTPERAAAKALIVEEVERLC